MSGCYIKPRPVVAVWVLNVTRGAKHVALKIGIRPRPPVAALWEQEIQRVTAAMKVAAWNESNAMTVAIRVRRLRHEVNRTA